LAILINLTSVSTN